jgi:2',3'-cyclic-nucleotide 2'-phosphodiesterase (5'-nucleotidase family)
MRYTTLLVLVLAVAMSCRTRQAVSYHIGTLEPTLISMDSLIVSDSETDSYISPFRDSVSMMMNRVIGQSDVPLTLGLPESPMSNFITDLILHESRVIAQKKGMPLPDISAVNIKGLRTPLPKGDITVGNIYQLMPFENQVVLLTLKGNEVRELLDHMASMGGDGIAGASFVVDNGKAEKALVDGKPIDDSRTYCIATSDYMANGGDKYYVFLKSKQTNLDITIRQMIMNHIEALTRSGKTVQTTTDKRVSYAK